MSSAAWREMCSISAIRVADLALAAQVLHPDTGIAGRAG
jgi:hypothetical protein